MADFWDKHLNKVQQYEIVDSVAGTCNSGCDAEYWQKEFGFNDEVRDELDWNFGELAAKFELFRCEDCQWWGDMGEVGECSECGGDLV